MTISFPSPLRLLTGEGKEGSKTRPLNGSGFKKKRERGEKKERKNCWTRIGLNSSHSAQNNSSSFLHCQLSWFVPSN